MKALLSIAAAAGVLGISPWTVRRYISVGRLRPVRIGRRVLLEEQELERLIQEGRAVEGIPQGDGNGEEQR